MGGNGGGTVLSIVGSIYSRRPMNVLSALMVAVLGVVLVAVGDGHSGGVDSGLGSGRGSGRGSGHGSGHGSGCGSTPGGFLGLVMVVLVASGCYWG